MSVVEVLTSLRGPHVLHTHPPIRGEADLHLTALDWTTSVKTLAFVLPDDRLVLVGVPGPAKLAYGAVARALGVPRSALRPAPEARLAALGMEPGGVSPICADPAVTVLFDGAVPPMGRLYCGGGTPELTVELDSSDLVHIAPGALVADITT